MSERAYLAGNPNQPPPSMYTPPLAGTHGPDMPPALDTIGPTRISSRTRSHSKTAGDEPQAPPATQPTTVTRKGAPYLDLSRENLLIHTPTAAPKRKSRGRASGGSDTPLADSPKRPRNRARTHGTTASDQPQVPPATQLATGGEHGGWSDLLLFRQLLTRYPS